MPFLNDEVKDAQLENHLSLVIEANKITNITRITSREEARVLHIEDSLAGLQELNNAPEGRYGDLGSGAGYPGIPLAIATGRETVLVDSVGKKTTILANMIEELGLSDHVGVYAGRIEDLSLQQPCSFSVLSARALSQLTSLLELANPLLKKHGQLICFKSHISDEELKHALSLENKLGMKLISDRDFTLSDGETYRRIVVFEKIHAAQIKLPRHVGFAQKKPL